jgi:hypothetical protein
MIFKKYQIGATKQFAENPNLFTAALKHFTAEHPSL